MFVKQTLALSKNPCTNACSNPTPNEMCTGCMRTGKEIKEWIDYTVIEKMAVNHRIKRSIKHLESF